MEPDQDLDAPEIDEPQGHRGGNTGKLILAVVVITLIAILLVPGREEDDKPAPLPKVERPSLLETPDEAAEAPGGQAQPEAAAPEDTGPGAAARRLIRELRAQPKPDLERAWQAAQRFEKEGRLDDALLLYYFAAREGHGPSAMILGRAADPASFRKDGLFQAPDELQARKWYLKAERAGVADAGKALAALQTRVEQAAAAGDARARRLMLLWK